MITKDQIKLLQSIEAAAYPKHMQYLQDARTWADIAEYCEGEDVEVLVKGHFYVLATREEVVDLASAAKLSVKDMLEVLAFLKGKYHSNPFSLDAREDTSYPLLKAMESRGRLLILVDEEWDWDGIAMHEMVLQFI